MCLGASPAILGRKWILKTAFYIDMPVIILSIIDSLNLVKVMSTANHTIFYVDGNYLSDYPQHSNASLSIALLRGDNNG